jgi:hypothetical protein
MKLAIIGGGPSAFYVASRILKLLPSPDFKIVRVHIFDRLWAPHGLVRYGVAPDHPEVKASSLGLNLRKHVFTDELSIFPRIVPINSTQQLKIVVFVFSGT